MNAIRGASGLFYAVLSSATFGLIPLFSIPLLSIGIGSPTILFYRFALAAVIMAIIMLAGGYSFAIRREVVGRVILLAMLYAATAVLLMESYKYIPSGIATTIHFLYPLVVTMVMSLIYRESMGRRRSSWRGLMVGPTRGTISQVVSVKSAASTHSCASGQREGSGTVAS